MLMQLSVGPVPAEGLREQAAGAPTHPQESHVSRHPLAPPTTELPHPVTWASAGTGPSPLHTSSSSHCLRPDMPSGQTPPGQFPRPQAAFSALSSVNTGKHVENISTKWSQKQGILQGPVPASHAQRLWNLLYPGTAGLARWQVAGSDSAGPCDSLA